MTAHFSQPLEAQEAYRLWAAGYDLENPVTQLDRLAAAELSPPVANLRLLDAACGTGRRMAAHSAGVPALAVGVDLARDMLLAGRGRIPSFSRLIQGDIRRLPLATGTMDFADWGAAAAKLDPTSRNLIFVLLALGFGSKRLSA